MNVSPHFTSRYSFSIDINKTDMNPFTIDLADKVSGSINNHWSQDDRSMDVVLLSGQKKTLPAKGGVYYIESGVNESNKALQLLMKSVPMVTRFVEKRTDKQVEEVLNKHNQTFTKEAYNQI